MRIARRRTARLYAIHLSAATWIALALQAIFVSAYLMDPLYEDVRLLPVSGKVAMVLANAAAVVLWFQLVGLLLWRWNRALRAGNLFSLLGLLALNAWHLQRGWALDYTVAVENVSLLRFAASWRLIAEHFTPLRLAIYAGGAAALAGLAALSPWMGRWPRPRRPIATALLTLAALAGLIVSPWSAHNEATYLARTAWDFYVPSIDYPDLPAEHYPYVVPAATDLPTARQNPHRPNVFIITMESFNGLFAGARTPDGREYTPFFNELCARGLYVEKFYGDSVQTPRGHFAIMASVLPSFRRKVSRQYPNLHVHSLAHILRDRGYHTLFFKAYENLEFDSTESFTRMLGFDVRRATTRGELTDEEKEHVWGWGVQDDIFYRKFFDWLDADRAKRLAEGPAGGDTRYFAMLLTVSHHMNFNKLPRDQQYLYPGTTDRREQFANSIYLADRYLREFFGQLERRDWLAGSIVIVTGDHSFPAGEHGYFVNEHGFYEENFRTPFVMIWDGHVAPRTVSRVAYCQLDIAPTVLDAMDIRAANHFRGRSMLPGDAAPQTPIFLIQPYGGTFLCVLDWPMKYVRSLRTRVELMFDLSADPMERKNVIGDCDGTPELSRLRGGIDTILINQRLIETDRLWPP